MLVLKMSNDKRFIITKRGNTYEDENNAEIIKIYLAKYINGIDLKDCSVWLCIMNKDGLGEPYELNKYFVEYSDDYYVVEKPIERILTYEPGNIALWIKILHTPTMMVAKTNEVIYIIQPHKEIENIIPEQEMSIIDSLVMKMDSTVNKVDEINDKVEDIDEYVNELQEGEVLIALPDDKTGE